MKRKSESSRRWLAEHFTDPYVKQAQLEGYRSRAVYKLLEIHKRDRLFKPGMTVVDLGAAPGGWSQAVVKLVHPKGRVIAMDILPMEPIPGVEFILGDFTEQATLDALLADLDGKADSVICDIAPNMSGEKSVDIPRAMYLAELSIAFALDTLKPEGFLLIKLFQGSGLEDIYAQIRSKFKKMIIRKPKASRERSREVYVLARELRSQA